MSRYSPISSLFSSSDNSGGSAPLPSIVLTVPGSQTYPSTNYCKMSAPGNVSQKQTIVRNDRIFVKRIALFCNFADGLLIDENAGVFDLRGYLRLEDSSVVPPPPSSLTSFFFKFPALNTWYDVNSFLDDGVYPSGFRNLYCAVDSFNFRTDSVSTAYNGEKANFCFMAETEHTFDLTL